MYEVRHIHRTIGFTGQTDGILALRGSTTWYRYGVISLVTLTYSYLLLLLLLLLLHPHPQHSHRSMAWPRPPGTSVAPSAGGFGARSEAAGEGSRA